MTLSRSLYCTYRASLVLDCRHFAVTSPSPIIVLRKSCFIIPTNTVKTQQLVFTGTSL